LAASYVRAYPQLIGTYLEARFITLGTDGFGRSDTRAALRQFFDVDRHHIVLGALQSLAESGSLSRTVLARAIEHYAIKSDAVASWMC
jgi:pyruvate dehydrogenase E1 component